MFIHQKAAEKSIRNISLDVENPRLIGFRKRDIFKTQRDLVRILVEHYDVLDICKSILRNGFHPDEILITIPKGDSGLSSIVVEGNRRLCACKVLMNPDLLKGSTSYATARKFKKDSNYEIIVKSIAKLNVVELPSRMAAASYLASKHTKSPIKSWSVYTQGAYYMSIKDDAQVRTLSEVKEFLNGQVQLQGIKRVVLFYQLSEFIMDMQCWDEMERKFLLDNIDNLKVEAITRLIGNRDFRKKIGIIKLDETGALIATGFKKSNLNAVIEKLTRDSHFAQAENGDFVLSTRQEDTPRILKYIESLCSISPDSDGIPDDKDIVLVGERSKKETNNVTKSDAVPKVRKQRTIYNRLLDENVIRPNSIPKLDEMVDEACRTNINAQKYSSVLLARAIIEITIKVIIKRNGLESDIRRIHQNKAWDFDTMLKYTNENIKKMSNDESVHKAIKSAITSLLTLSKDVMNLTNHNEIHALTLQEALHIKGIVQTFANAFFETLSTE